jgi:hypothetical protein
VKAAIQWTGITIVGLFTIVGWTALWLFIGSEVEERTKPPVWECPACDGQGEPVFVIGLLAPLWLLPCALVGALILDGIDALRRR